MLTEDLVMRLASVKFDQQLLTEEQKGSLLSVAYDLDLFECAESMTTS
jgi:hypothetical protein